MNFELKIGDEDSTRYGRACRLVIEAGTLAVRDYVLNNLNPPRADGLPATLRALRELFDKLRRDSIITLDQFQVLYPPSGTDVRTEDLDLTMWVMLVRNATTASDKSVKRMKGLAPNNEQLVRDHVFKIRNARNVLFHKARHELDETEFDQIWLDVSAAILYLRRITPGERDVNYAYVLEQLKKGDLDQRSTTNSVFLVQKQSLEELRRIALKEASRKRWTIVALIIHLVLALATIGGVLVAVLIVKRSCSTCIDNVEYIRTDGGIVMYMRRDGWGAVEPREERVPLKTPVQYVIISHTALLGRCTTTEKCCRDARKVQKFNMETSHFADIAYNGLIGNNGIILDGRGFDVQAATAYGWNSQSLGFAFMGMFIRDVPGEEALAALQNFLGYLVTRNKLRSDYIIYGLCQVRPFPLSPGARLYREIQTWPHWVRTLCPVYMEES
ncbi:hypothetical protein NP493_124g04037 [Ridgeia piscesae]|uniref:Peptidoglycan recognition protein family domain-containing protein n=1 Tax=Ridgeia piscesae TaxID=27915 RepID=A0AAD9UGN9_RIDPI|nr:hypothetical protein NP493_124g04037 [Ridgeia piscesae]